MNKYDERYFRDPQENKKQKQQQQQKIAHSHPLILVMPKWIFD